MDLAYLVSHALTLRQTALTDPLTGLMSRRDFKEQGENAVRAATRNGQPLSCLAFDIDHFKRINDRYGHAAGDSVLAGLVAVCQSAVPDCKLFGRLGGEEFAILLPQTDRVGAMAVAETLRSAIEGQPFYLGDERVVVTASFGTAGLDPSTRELDSLLSNADASLYRAKISGRNRTVSWQARDSELPLGRRRRVLKSGRIVFNNRMSTIDCTVRALGEQGASLDVTSTVDIPERFALCIPSDHLDANCRIVERGERRLEVEFR